VCFIQVQVATGFFKLHELPAGMKREPEKVSSTTPFGFDSFIFRVEIQRVAEIKFCDSFLFAGILPEDGGKEGKTGINSRSEWR